MECNLKDQQHSESVILQLKVSTTNNFFIVPTMKWLYYLTYFAFNYNVVKQVKELECKLKEQAHSENVAAQKVVSVVNQYSVLLSSI